MGWVDILLGYRIHIHIIRWGSTKALQCWDEVLDTAVKSYVASVDTDFVSVRVPIEMSSSKSTWRVRGLRVVSDRRTRLCLNTLKIFRIPSLALCVQVSHPKLLSQTCKLLYRRNGDYLMLHLLIISC